MCNPSWLHRLRTRWLGVRTGRRSSVFTTSAVATPSHHRPTSHSRFCECRKSDRLSIPWDILLFTHVNFVISVRSWQLLLYFLKNRKTFTTNYCRSGRPVTAWASLWTCWTSREWKSTTASQSPTELRRKNPKFSMIPKLLSLSYPLSCYLSRLNPCWQFSFVFSWRCQMWSQSC